ncbi:Histone acetyltransferase complex subunit [Rhizophlyctis rosea]|uniref:Chromatin modification-related protein n=1 Tax=Rhizophlyctis rosea TaxID=64517 RepID=A0AAD5S991_9FUNG|nr:Histone acetyltransferase complex subunit [Rhizophlyctis rosea]
MAASTSKDPQEYLMDYLQSVENLAPEINHIFSELMDKEYEFQAVRKQATGQHLSLHRPRSHQPIAREEVDAVRGIRKAYGRAGQVAGEKLEIANKALSLLEAHLKRLDAEIAEMGIELPVRSSVEREEVGGRRRVGREGRKRRRGEKRDREREEEVKIEDDETESDYDFQEEDTTTYCFCHDVSYGDMIACDNPGCPYEWFHYDCVGLTAPPKGKWFCQDCEASMGSRAGRKRKMDEGGR